MAINLPHKFNPRPYQLPFLAAIDSDHLPAVQVWNRKSLKEKTDWKIVKKLTQVRKVLWEGIYQDDNEQPDFQGER